MKRPVVLLKLAANGCKRSHENATPYFCHRVMSKKKQGRTDGLVYSTNQDYYNDFQESAGGQETLPKDKQRLRVQLDTRQRAGKVVTLVANFAGSTDDLEALGKQLKTKCGTGGSVKDGLIIIQGDYKEKIVAWLKDWGYTQTR